MLTACKCVCVGTAALSRQAGKQASRQAGRQAGRQTGRQSIGRQASHCPKLLGKDSR